MGNTTISMRFRYGMRLCIIFTAVLCLSGCFSSPGETSQEINLKHKRVLKTNIMQLQDDIDAYLLLDRPSKLSDKYVR